MKKRCFAGVLILSFLLGMGYTVNMAQAADNPAIGPTVVVSPGAAPIDKNAKFVIMGSGFKAGQEISVLFQDDYGAFNEVKEVKVNKRGNWATVWTLGRYTRGGIIKDGIYAIMAADRAYNILASTPVGFVKATNPPKKWPKWAKPAGIKPMKK